MKELDLKLAETVSRYMGGPIPQDHRFVPSKEKLDGLNQEINSRRSEVDAVSDPFWRQHFIGALESLSFQVECNTKLPYEHITRLSSGLDRALAEAERGEFEGVTKTLRSIEPVVEAVGALAVSGSRLAQSQVADVLPPLLRNIEKTLDLIVAHGVSEGQKADAAKWGGAGAAAVKKVQSMVKAADVGSMSPVDIPFEVSVEKGMQAPLDYVLSWYEDDARSRGEEFFRMAAEMFPGQNPEDILAQGGGFTSVEAVMEEMRDILDHLQAECQRFVDLPEGEHCEIGLIPETWRVMVPGFMYMGGMVAINPDNLDYYKRPDLETTSTHEVYPGHHVNSVKSARNALPHTFRLPLFWSRCMQEGMCDRSMVMMTPHFRHPAAPLSVAKRLYFTATRVKAEVDIYYNKKSPQTVIDNYIQNLGLPSYNAHAQTRAHMMRPADAISYYTGMKYLQDLGSKSKLTQKEFTNEIFSYGQVSLKTQEGILALPEGKKEQLKAFTAK